INNGYTTVDVLVAGDGDITVTAKVTDPAGNSSATGEQTITVDTTPPSTPTITPNDDGSVKVDLPDDADQVVVNVPQEDGSTVPVTLTKDPEGNWTSDKPEIIPSPTAGEKTATIPDDKVKDGGEVTAVAKDPAGNESSDKNTAGDPADNPSVTPSDTDGSVTVTPGADNNKVVVEFPDEEGNPVTVTLTKDPDGIWTSDNPDYTPDANGTITIPQDNVKDGEPVKATGTNDAGKTAESSDKAPTDSQNAGVAKDGVTLNGPVNEGDDLIATVKLDNNNGNPKLPFGGISGGANNGITPAEDVGEPKFSNGVTINEDGSLNVPAGVTEFTITYPTIADNKTEGNETAKVSVGGVDGPEATITDSSTTPVDPADKPTVTPSETDGSVTVTPGANNNKVVVEFPDEDGNKVTVTLTKGSDGTWTSDNPDYTPGADGTITIPQDNVKDGEKVTATGTNPSGESDTGEGLAGTDSANAGVDPSTDSNGASVGVVSSTPVDEGASIETTVKLTNNNGNENLAFSLPNGTATGQLNADDFDDSATFTFSDGVKMNADGTLNVPAGVTEFTITTPVKADQKTEGAETGKFTVGGVEGNEVTVNDTSATPAKPADKPTVTPSTTDGSVEIVPGLDNNKVEITFTNEKDEEVTVTLTKDPATGTWASDNPAYYANSSDGSITIPQDSVKDETIVTAKGTNDAGNSDTGTGEAGKDSGNAHLADSDAITLNGPVNEGDNLVATIKLNNNNGNPSLAFSGISGGANKPINPAEDVGTPTFSDGVTLNTDGSLNVPAGVTEFTITYPTIADNKTEGDETAKVSIDGVDSAEATITDSSTTPIDPADKPDVIPSTTDGSVTVTPGADNNKVVVQFLDEEGTIVVVTLTKDSNGDWTSDNTDYTPGANGSITIPQDSVQDSTLVSATGTNDAGNRANSSAFSGTDSVNAGVDPSTDSNGASVGVVSSTPVDEGASIETTVKLTNNNGNEKLAFSLPNGTGAGQLSADDFDDSTTFTFSDGVKMNADGTLNVPAGVTSFTITTPVKADETTEEAETGKFTVGGVEGNEVTVNDTSKADETPKIDINNIAGQAQVTEGTDGYAQFLPSNIATVEISNATENGVTKVEKGFVVSGTTNNVPENTEVTITIQQADSTVYYTGKATVAANGTWELKVPTSTVTTTVTGTGEDEVTDVTTVFNNPKFDVSYDVSATVTVNGETITDTDKTESAPVVTDIYLEDKLTDDNPDVANFYTDTDKYVGRVDGMADTDATKAMTRQTGLTNDPSAELHFTLDKAPQAGQVVKVLRYTIVDGNEGRVEDLTADMTNNGLDYTVKPTTPQPETVNTLYRYKVQIEDANGTDLSEKVFNYRLDTIVESMDVKELNSDTNTMVLQADGISELGATIKYKYYTGTGESALKDVVDNGDGTYTLNLANWNRKVNGSITLQIIDAAGNVSETKINAVRNLFTSYTADVGPDPNGTRFDKGIITGFAQSSTDKDNGAFVSTDGNDTLIVGLDNFGGMGLYNGSVGRQIAVGAQVHIEMGKGDDHIQVRGTVQSMGADTDGYFDMGDGNDKLTFSETFVIGNYNIRMGEGNNIVNFGGTTVQAAGLDISYGDGNDVLRADVNKDFAGGKTINFGNGDNYMEVGAMHDKNTITFGEGSDVFIAKSVGTKAPASGVIDMGDGNDTFVVSGLFARQEAKLGAGDDVAIMGDRIETGAAWGRLDGGEGDDTLVLTKSDGKVSLQNVLNFEVIDLTAPTTQTIGISNDYINQANDTTKSIYIKGSTNDTVDFGDNGKYIDGAKFKDGGGVIKSNWNFWEKTDSDVMHDGITYDKYTYRTSAGEVNDEAIYIQQGVQII
ncbi:beta strand repeat-containing protein, partial [Rodentibacter myodis]|uniref:beta strand repeat-containing protein n=1 Tax=Rodentibacter myodis TaxID=1907939 RepID=UPI003CC66E9E